MTKSRQLLLLILLLLPLPALADAATDAFAAGQTAFDDEDYRTALEQWRRAAALEHSEAEFRLGAMYEEGLGVEVDLGRAVHWYERAARHGSERAQFNLGHMYGTGSGVPEDESQAAHWYGMAAERGNAHAQYALGLIHYRGGTGIERDLVSAWFWLTVAANSFGVNALRDNANQIRQQASERMSEAELVEAQQRLQAWQSARD